LRTSDTGARLIRAGLAWSVVLLALAEALRSYALSIAAGGEAYQTADWLINYSGGFVRRGLFGSVYLALFPQGQLGLWGLFSLQVLFCVVPLAYALTWLHKSDYSWLGIALVCGPAALTFTGWDPVAFARKESLALTALTLLAIAAFPYRKSGTQRALTIGALLIFAVGVFSWEANALFLPGIAFLIYLGFRGRASGREGWVYAIGAATISGIGLVASMLFRAQWQLPPPSARQFAQRDLTARRYVTGPSVTLVGLAARCCESFATRSPCTGAIWRWSPSAYSRSQQAVGFASTGGWWLSAS
jgi:hypothetical protein